MTNRSRRVGSTRPGPAWSPSCRRLLAGLVAALAVCGTAVFAESARPARQPRPQAAEQKREKSLAKLAEPWPDAAVIEKRRTEAEGRRLFQTLDPLPFTLKADFKAINADRNPAETRTFPGMLTIVSEGRPVSFQVGLRPRGTLRRQARICDQVPLRIDFPKEGRTELDGSVFEGQKDIKLATHCRDDDTYEQYILKEYLAYRLFNVLSPRSLRVRLARGTYVESRSGKTVATRYAFFLESEEDVARRLGARVAKLTGTRFADHDQDTLLRTFIFEFMIGNTDFSISGLHNFFILETRSGTLYPMTHDFDVTGLVNPPYAVPDRRLRITSLQERRYRGPCKSAADLEPTLALFREKKAEMLRAIEHQAGLSADSAEAMREYLQDFFSLIDSRGRVKSQLIDTCNKDTV